MSIGAGVNNVTELEIDKITDGQEESQNGSQESETDKEGRNKRDGGMIWYKCRELCRIEKQRQEI